MGNEISSLGTYLGEKLRQRDTYYTALVVGLLINVYSQLLVPLLRGHEDPLAKFSEEFETHPILVSVSIGLGFCFPFLVGIYAAVTTRYARRKVDLRVWFPDYKPDPVFRVDTEGNIVDMGATTEVLFRRTSVKKALDVLGNDLWQRIRQISQNSAKLIPRTKIEFDGDEYLVGWSSAPNGTINLYLARTSN